MNKRIFGSVILLVLTLSMLASFFFGRIIIDKSIESYNSGIEGLVDKNLENLTLTARNDLINENIRLAKIIIEKNISEGSFSAYAIFKDGTLVEKSDNYDAVVSHEDIKKYIKQVQFSEFGKNQKF